MPTFDMDERLFDPEHAMPGLLTITQVHDLEEEWKAAKVEEWATYSRLVSATAALFQAAGLPDKAPVPMAWIRAVDRAEAGCSVAARAVTVYQEAARAYELVRSELVRLRARALGG